MNAVRNILLSAALLGSAASAAAAQTPFEACYVPSVGALYLINLPGLPTACLAAEHVGVSWTDGGALADGSVTVAKLAFDPATQTELDSIEAGLATTGAINTPSNPVDWTQLKNVPADFADGVDQGGGGSSDLACSGCVDDGDIASRTVTAGKLAFDPATQTELEAVIGGLTAAGTVNQSTNPVDWSQLKSVPLEFADGIDDRGPSVHSGLTGLATDDHTQYLLANGVRTTNDGFAVAGTLNAGSIPATGAGVRLMWYPGKGAFRVGRVISSEWDDGNVGEVSTAVGARTTASGDGSFASGVFTTASGATSTAMGSGSRASGNSSTAIGDGAIAIGASSTAFGSATASAYSSVAIGRWNVVGGSDGFWNPADPLLVAGNGSSAGSLSNALTLSKSGNLTIAGALTQSSDIRLKEDIEPVDDALDGVLRLTPIRYRFREGTGHPTESRIGLSAQEVREIFPELVEEDMQGFLGVAYTDLAAILVRAMQEQQAEVDSLRRTVDELRGDRRHQW
jgi:hypothetical protein